METEEKQTSQPENNSDQLESLEAQTTTVESDSTTDGETLDASKGAGDSAAPAGPPPKKKKVNPIKGLAGKFNIYFLLFIFVLVIAGVVTAISFIKNQQADKAADKQIKTEPLSQEDLNKLRQTDVKVGDPKSVLSVESNAIFAGKVLIRDSLEVAGEIKTGSPLTVGGLTVNGNTLLNQVSASSLQLSGNGNIQGQLNVQNNLSVAGSGSFGGSLTAKQLNIQNLQINGDIQFTRHIDAGGGTPGKSDGPALGGGGTSSISGTDSAGTVAINTGGGTGPGCFVNINFSQRYNSTPHVVITPVGSAGGAINYYLNRSSTGFSICTTNAAPAGQSFAFDYIVID